MFHFAGQTANDAWLASVLALTSDVATPQPGRGGPTREILHAMYEITAPRQRWVVARTPAINPAFAIAEIIWMVRGRRDAQFLNYWNRRLPCYAGQTTEYAGAYGYRLRKHFGLDQLERAYHALSSDPSSRQVVLQIWDPRADLPSAEGRPSASDIPCNVSALLKVRDGRLEWSQVVRSNDIFLGVPYNFVQFTAIQEVLAGWLGVEPGTYHHFSDSLHVYEHDFSRLVEARDREPVQPPWSDDTIGHEKTTSEKLFAQLERAATILSASCSKSDDLTEAQRVASDLPAGFRNMALVLVAESARRRGEQHVMEAVMADCTNAALGAVWSAWSQRSRSRRTLLEQH